MMEGTNLYKGLRKEEDKFSRICQKKSQLELMSIDNQESILAIQESEYIKSSTVRKDVPQVEFMSKDDAELKLINQKAQRMTSAGIKKDVPQVKFTSRDDDAELNLIKQKATGLRSSAVKKNVPQVKFMSKDDAELKLINQKAHMLASAGIKKDVPQVKFMSKDDAELNLIKQKAKRLRSAAVKKETKIPLVDIMFNKEEDYKTSRELKRAAINKIFLKRILCERGKISLTGKQFKQSNEVHISGRKEQINETKPIKSAKNSRRLLTSIKDVHRKKKSATHMEAMMSGGDVDPLTSKCIRLLHSKAKDSEDQLRQLLVDEVKKRCGKDIGPILKKYTTTKGESSSLDETPKEVHIIDERDEDDDEDTNSEINLEILEEDLSCVVCREMDVGPRNRLVECSECHSLYHQECHQPPVSEADMEDPRSIWYCFDCIKTINRMNQKASHSSPKNTPSTIASSLMKDDSTRSSYKTENSSSGLFKRADKSSSMTINRKEASAPNTVGMAGLAASLQTSSKSSYIVTSGNTLLRGGGSSHTLAAPQPGASTKLTALSSASKSSLVPKINIISADKRLANMKKKAAKLQEKRKHSK